MSGGYFSGGGFSEGGQYGTAQPGPQFLGSPSIIEQQAEAYRSLPPRQDDIVMPQRTAYYRSAPVTTATAGPRVYASNQISPQDYDLYQRYLTVARPYDVVTDSYGGSSYTGYSGYSGSNGMRLDDPDPLLWSGKWRPIRQLMSSNQPSAAYAAPPSTSYVTRTVDYSNAAYQGAPGVGGGVLPGVGVYQGQTYQM